MLLTMPFVEGLAWKVCLYANTEVHTSQPSNFIFKMILQKSPPLSKHLFLLALSAEPSGTGFKGFFHLLFLGWLHPSGKIWQLHLAPNISKTPIEPICWEIFFSPLRSHHLWDKAVLSPYDSHPSLKSKTDEFWISKFLSYWVIMIVELLHPIADHWWMETVYRSDLKD